MKLDTFKALMRRAVLLLTPLCLALMLLSPCALAAQPKVIRVGYPIQAGLTEVDESGRYSGYTYEFLQEISQYTGWTYEFVQLEGSTNEIFMKMMDMLETGELDLLTGLTYSDALAEKYSYPASSYGTSYTVLRVDEDNTTLTDGNLQTAKNLRIAVPKGKMRVSQLERFCQLNSMTPTLITYQTDAEQLSALKKGEVDALLSVDLVPMQGTRTILKLDPRPFYIATTKGNLALTHALNAAIMQVEAGDPYFTTTLYEKYFGNNTTHLVFSDTEQAYLDQKPVLKVGVTADKAPFQYKDPKSEELQGISIDILDAVTAETGLTVDYVYADTAMDLAELLEDGKVDIIATLLHDYGSVLRDTVSFSRPYLRGQYVLVYNSKLEPQNFQEKRLTLMEWLDNRKPTKSTTLYLPTAEACLAAVDRGDADYTYINSHSVQYELNRARYSHISAIPQSNEGYQLCFGVAKSANPMLLSVLNKVILHTPEEVMQSIIYSNSSNYGAMSVTDLMLYNPLILIVAVLAFSVILIGSMMFYLHIRNRFTKRMKLDVERYHLLAELSNEFMFEYNYMTDTLTLSEKSAQKVFHCDRALEHYGAEMEKRYLPPIETLYSHLKSGQDCCDDALIHLWDSNCSWMRIIAKVAYSADGTPAYAVGKLVDIAADVKERTALLRQAQTDSLTGIYNSATCRSVITTVLATMPQETVGAFCMLDVDKFKDINDQLGHYTGDEALIAIANAMRKIFAYVDFYGRLGGDEFVFYLHNPGSRNKTLSVCNQLQELVRHCLTEYPEREVTLSIGVAPAHRGDTFDELFKIADDALYRVKERGRDGVEFSEAE
ncbi:MAG: transporter substrate-binding domain-containing protein [Oscillospiraceae bacterium]